MDQRFRDDYWMQQAMDLADLTPGTRHPNPKVACMIVQGDQCLASGVTEQPPGRHAERVAFEALGSEKKGPITVYVTLEPCFHTGKQPPCVDLLLRPEVARVVISCLDPNPLVAGKSVQQLQAFNKEVVLGVQEKRARWQHAAFFSSLKKQTLFVGKWASSIDGQLYDDTHTSKWITGQSARAYARTLRSCFEAIVIGAETLLKDQPSLCGRDNNPHPIFFDPKGKLSRKPFSRPSSIATSPQALWELCHQFGSVFVEGGPRTLSEVFPRLDILVVFTGNVFLGGQKGRILAPYFLPYAKRWELLQSISLDQDTCTTYQRPLDTLPSAFRSMETLL
jgi:pyrimidine deaminase RibD-like protein/riboflavin biosynthesis pyrimidine reductase